MCPTLAIQAPSRVALDQLLHCPFHPGNIYGIPWRSSSILEFDPETKVIRLFGKLDATNYTW